MKRSLIIHRAKCVFTDDCGEKKRLHQNYFSLASMGCEAQRKRPANGTPTMTSIVFYFVSCTVPLGV